MTPAEELAHAADNLDALVGKARPGPWGTESTVHPETGQLRWKVSHIRDYPWLEVAYDMHEPNAAYIAAMNPLVGKALAQLLRNEGICEGDGLGINPDALALARLINGSES